MGWKIRKIRGTVVDLKMGATEKIMRTTTRGCPYIKNYNSEFL